MAPNQDELGVLGAAAATAQAGTGFVVNENAARATCDGLVQSGHLIELEDVDGGYAPSPEFAAAS